MLPISTGALLTRHLIAHEFLGPNAVHSQLIRWKRKPLWLGTAKSKVFRVPPRPVIPKEEALEIQRLSNNYRTYRTSIRFFYMKLIEENSVQFDEESVRKAQVADYERCLELNDQWNKEVAKSREAREARQLQARKEQVLENIMAKEQRDKIIMEEVEEKVRKAKAEAVTFITEKNIDQAIEEALANVVNYDAAIDTEGNRYEGKYEPEENISRNDHRLQFKQ